MNTYQAFLNSSTDLFCFAESLFEDECEDFNFELTPHHILSEVTDLESMHTYIFNPNEEVNELKIKINSSDCQEDINCGHGKEKECSQLSIIELKLQNKVQNVEETLADEVRKPLECSLIDNQINDIFKSKKNKCNVLANRRDVINKAILRGFKKFFTNLLNSKTLRFLNSPNASLLETKLHLEEALEEKGLLALKSKHTPLIEFKEFICWLGFAKITKKVKTLFSSGNSSIILMEDILSNYSHHKMNKVLKNESIRVLLSYFISHGKEQFMNNFESDEDFNSSFSSNLQK